MFSHKSRQIPLLWEVKKVRSRSRSLKHPKVKLTKSQIRAFHHSSHILYFIKTKIWCLGPPTIKMSPATIAMIVQIVPDYQAKRPIFLAIHNSVINQHREFIYNSGKFFFTSFWASFRRRILCRLDWPVTGYTGQENFKFLFHSLQHLENWDCRHVPSWLCLVETMVLCILGIQSIN